MKQKTLLITIALLALVAGTASARGVNLFWNDCSPAAGGAGVSDQQNDCTSNAGQFILIGSLVPGPGITQCVGEESVIAIDVAAPTLSPWWQMRSGGCRFVGIATQFSFDTLTSCLDPWSGQAVGGMDYAYNPPDNDPSDNLPNRAILKTACTVPVAAAVPLTPDAEYYMFQITINKRKSVGTGSCSGCTDPALFTLRSIRITQPDGNPGGNPTYTSADQSQVVTYRGAATPTRNRTWGGIKALYR